MPSLPVIEPDQCRAGTTDLSNASVNKTSSKAPTWTLGSLVATVAVDLVSERLQKTSRP